MPAPPARLAAPPAAALDRVPPQGLFVLGAVAQYVGSSFAVLLFSVVPASGVAWLRVLTAAGALALWRRPWQTRWTPRRLALAGAFGITLAAMNLCFYLAIDRLPLGTAVAIEFWGPIAVATAGSRSRRDAAALALALGGVLLLADVRFAGTPAGVGFAAAAGGLWAAYVVLGHRVAADAGLRARDGLAAGMAIGALAFAPFLVASAGPAFEDAWRLAACVAVGLLSSVIPYALEQLALARLPRARFALLLALLPATAAVVGAVILGQLPRGLEVLGIGLVIAASALRTHEAP
jgi:inner membrane transporter RhtA